MSRYRGNGQTCPTCGQTYGAFRCEMICSYRDAFAQLMDNSPDPADWKYKRRGTVLGYWHMIKRLEWERHLNECAAQAAFEEETRGDAWEPPATALEPPTDGLPF